MLLIHKKHKKYRKQNSQKKLVQNSVLSLLSNVSLSVDFNLLRSVVIVILFTIIKFNLVSWFGFAPIGVALADSINTTNNNGDVITIEDTKLKDESDDESDSASFISTESSSTITRKTIQNSSTRNVAELLRTQTGLTVTQNGGDGQMTTVSIRGLNPGNTLVLYNGITLNDAISIDDSYDFSNLDTDTLSSVRIVKSPSSINYGSNALGGVVELNTVKRPDYNVKLSQYFGSYNATKSSVEVSAHNKNVYATVSYSEFYTDAINSAKGKHNKKNNPYYSEHKQLSTGVNDDYDENGADLFIEDINSTVALDRCSGDYCDDHNYYYDNEQKLMSAKIYFTIPLSSQAPHSNNVMGVNSNGFASKIKETLMVTQSETGRFYFNDVDKQTSSNSINGISLKGSDARGSELWRSKTQTAKLTAEYNATERHSLAVSIGEKRQYGETPGILNKDLESSYVSTAYDYNYYNLILFSAGVRQDITQTGQNDSKAYTNTYNIAFAKYIETISTKLRLTHSTGFTEPTIFQRYSNFGNASLHPEKSENYEVGLDYSPELEGVNAQFTNSLSLFQNHIKNMIVTAFDSSIGTYRYSNMQNVIISGIEDEVSLSTVVTSYSIEPRVNAGVTQMYIYDKVRKEKIETIPATTAHVSFGVSQKNVDLELNTRYVGKWS